MWRQCRHIDGPQSTGVRANRTIDKSYMNTPTQLNSKTAREQSCARPPRVDASPGRPHEIDNNLTVRTAAFLDAHHVMSLATMGAEGPHAANLFYARDGYALIWVSDPTSHHSRHIEEHAEVAATIARDCCDFPDVQGLQIRGRAWRIVHPQEEAPGVWIKGSARIGGARSAK
jgi:Pyridoxamine 5'-phosphate oxidase